ncbi:MAG: gamma-glutamyltransferase [Pirellula sp.]|nr:gamma-glutamyltransferase [Pirellula sp.]
MVAATTFAFAPPVVDVARITPATKPRPPVEKVAAERGIVVCISPPAADVGAELLRRGGNAVDAAVGTALAMAVTFPEAGNIGGGGFMMIRPVEGEPTCIEYRETAPAKCRVDTFVRDTQQLGHRTVGVPGTLRGLEMAHKKYGKLKWREVALPAVRLAREGFAIDAVLAADLNRLVADGEKFPEFVEVFGKRAEKRGEGTGARGEPEKQPEVAELPQWQAGDVLKQPELGDTLERIARLGPDEFYTGVTAELIVEEMRRGKGFVTEADLEAYRATERKPVHGTYRGYDIYSSPPPSSGGTVLVETLNILEQFPLKDYGRYSPQTLHLVTEAMKRAYADRARFIGDPAFTEIPAHLTTKEYAKQLAAGISREHATPSAKLAPEIKLGDESPSTTHFSVVDGAGMAVSNTYTLQASYGSRVVVRGAGFILNNELTDFNWKPGVTDRTGRIGTPANQIAPGKRMLSSQCPTIIARDGKLVLVTGSPGGRTIPNTVINVVLNVLEFDMDVDAAVAAPRTHHQWFPDELRFEGADLPEHADTVAALVKLGHRVQKKPVRQGDAHSIIVRDGKLYGAADTRRTLGKAAAE